MMSQKIFYGETPMADYNRRNYGSEKHSQNTQVEFRSSRTHNYVSCPAKTFSLYTEIPLPSLEELYKVERPTHSKYYKGSGSELPMLWERKAKKVNVIGCVG